MFRKKRQQGDGDDQLDGPDDIEDVEDSQDAQDFEDVEEAAEPDRPGRGQGPFDLAEVDDPAASGRVDLGGLWLPGRPGLEVRIEADQETSEVVAVTLVLGEGALQVQPFAAPRSEGIGDDVRAEIRAGITKQGGTADEVDGPRWFLRGVLTGKPAVQPGPETDAELFAVFREIVVVRGDEAMAPRDPIPLRLPVAPTVSPAEAGMAEEESELKPFERGPEITEIH